MARRIPKLGDRFPPTDLTCVRVESRPLFDGAFQVTCHYGDGITKYTAIQFGDKIHEIEIDPACTEQRYPSSLEFSDYVAWALLAIGIVCFIAFGH